MQPRTLKTRFRRLFRLRRRQALALSATAEDQFERNFLRRFDRLRPVWRFVAGWLVLVLLLIGCVALQTRALAGYYKSLQPAAGGIYSEGIVDTYSNASPIYAVGPANSSVSKLIFAGLFTYDTQNKLVGDLAESWQADPQGRRYTILLKPGLVWHDGQPLTADDVVFTYRSIQNPDVQSPLYTSWLDVKVSAPDARTVVFDLPSTLSAFPQSLTNGIVPKHLLQDVAPASMRSQRFNTVAPVGAGPFKMKAVEVSGSSPTARQEEIALVPFERYHAGTAKISSFIVRTYGSQESMLQAFRDQKINAMVDPQAVSTSITNDGVVQTYSLPLTAANMIFFKTSQGILADKAVRQALVAAADPAKFTAGLPRPVLPVRSPLLQSSPGYDPKFVQTYEGADKASAMLDAAGWARQPNGPRKKGAQALTFKLYAQQTPENETVLKALAKDWKAIGVEPQMVLQPANDLNATVSGIGGNGGHAYDALLYGISLGVDPDVYAYWHSRQADIRSSRLNFSEYKSMVADLALEAGRTRTEASLRAVKYQPFLQAWQADAPALGLYQPRFSYVTRGQVYGFEERTLTQATDRFNMVHDWMVRREPQPIK